MKYENQLHTVLRTWPHIAVALLLLLILASSFPALGQATIEAKAGAKNTRSRKPLCTYTLVQDGTPASYDEALAVFFAFALLL